MGARSNRAAAAAAWTDPALMDGGMQPTSSPTGRAALTNAELEAIVVSGRQHIVSYFGRVRGRERASWRGRGGMGVERRAHGEKNTHVRATLFVRRFALLRMCASAYVRVWAVLRVPHVCGRVPRYFSLLTHALTGGK